MAINSSRYQVLNEVLRNRNGENYEKYKPLILWHLINKTLRFNEISKLIPKATPKMLTQQLRELERDLLIIRVVYPVVPPKVEYSLSNLGKSIIPVLDAMCNWGEGYLDGQSCK